MAHPLVDTMDILAKHAQALVDALVLTRDSIAKMTEEDDERTPDQD